MKIATKSKAEKKEAEALHKGIKLFSLMILSLIITLSIASCTEKENKADSRTETVSEHYEEFGIAENSCPYALFHGGVTYYYTGETVYDNIDYTAGDEIGKVTSSISEMSMPTEEGQANIDIVGSPFIYHGDGLLVLIDGDWIVFERRDGEETDNTHDVTDLGDDSADNDMIKMPSDKPPELTVSHGDESVTAMRGSYSWIYTDENGEEMGICADGLHPLQAREYMPTLSVKPQIYSHISPKMVYLNFEVAPQEISARAWKSEDFGNIDAESITVTVNTVEVDFSDGGYDTYSELEIFDDEYVYEITARWGNKEKDGFEGTAYYAFISKCVMPEIIDM